MKSLLLGILFIIIVGIGGLVYRNAAEHPLEQIACPMDAQLCPDGTSVGRTGSSCTFPACPPPNVTLPDANISFALPDGFSAAELSDDASIAAYEAPAAASSSTRIIIRRYAVDASSTPLATIQQTAISGTSGAPVPVTSFTSSVINQRRFTVVMVERFEGMIDTAYYLARGADVLRFDAVDDAGADWMDSNLDVTTLPAHAALAKILGTLQVVQ